MDDLEKSAANTAPTSNVYINYGVNSAHPDLVDYSQGLVEYLSEAILKHNEMVNHVVELRAKLDIAYKALGLEVYENKNSISLADVKAKVEKEINAVEKKVTSTAKAVEKEVKVSFFKRLWKWF